MSKTKQPASKKFFRVQDALTKAFWQPKSYSINGRWNLRGQLWKRLADVKNIFRYEMKRDKNCLVKSSTWEVVVYELVEVERLPIHMFLNKTDVPE